MPDAFPGLVEHLLLGSVLCLEHREYLLLLRAELAAGIFGLRLFIACVAVGTVMLGRSARTSCSTIRSITSAATSVGVR